MLMPRAFGFPSILLTALAACAAEEPTQYSRGQAIPVAAWTVTLLSMERLPETMFPAPVRSLKPDVMWVGVHLDLDYEDPDGGDWERDFKRLLAGVRLAGEGGEEHKPILAPMTESHLKMMKYGSSASLQDYQAWMATSDWERVVLVFAPPKDSRGLSLRVRNYEPRDQQPKAAVVATGL